jgi:telomerase protein component 1
VPRNIFFQHSPSKPASFFPLSHYRVQGNKASTWESLIDHNKLPFMAMLRNLRNVIKANVNPRYHNMIIGRLRSEKAVVNSKQFPFRFFSAYEVLTELIEPKPERPARPGKPARPAKVCLSRVLLRRVSHG